MAHIHPTEGLDLVINTLLRKTGSQVPATCYIGLFTSQTPTTVPAATAVLATDTGVTEAAGGGYERVAIASTDWPAPVASGSARRSTVPAPGIAFPESTGPYNVTQVNGFFVATAAVDGIALFYANFTSGQPVHVNQTGFVVRIPPFYEVGTAA